MNLNEGRRSTSFVSNCSLVLLPFTTARLHVSHAGGKCLEYDKQEDGRLISTTSTPPGHGVQTANGGGSACGPTADLDHNDNPLPLTSWMNLIVESGFESATR